MQAYTVLAVYVSSENTGQYSLAGGIVMPRVVHFEIHTDEPERAAKFYSDVFGWEIKKWEGPTDYWLVMTGKNNPGIDGGLVKRGAPAKGDSIMAYVCTVDVPSVDEYAEKITAKGGSVAEPKMAVPGVGWLAYFRDTEGNMFGIMQNDPSAK